MITRRDFLKLGTFTGAGLMFPIAFGSRTAYAARPFVPPVSPVLTKYMDLLPIPGQVAPTPNSATGFHELALSMSNASHSFHNQLGPAQTFGYGGATYLGPTIIARRGQPIKLTATNGLKNHPLTALVTPDPMNVMGVKAGDATAPRASIHLHGGYNRMDSDGGPMDFFPNPTIPAMAGNTYTYTYANDQQAATLWYHDHAFGLTRANVYAGLAGYYLLRDEFDTGDPGNPVGLPAGYGTYEIPLVIQDKSFNADGTLFYAPSPAWIPEFFGDVAVVNGKAWPKLDVQQAVYRFRILNGSQARFYDLRLSNGQVFYQIGTDSGLLDAPVALSSLVIAPGERADILVDFTGCAIGDTIVLQNNAPAPYPNGKRTNRAGGVPLPEIMQFTVAAAAATGAVTTLPASLRGGIGQPPLVTRLSAPAHTASIVRQRYMVLFEVMGPVGPIAVTINVLEFSGSLNGPNGISGTNAVAKDTLEQWNIINLTGDTHPMHTHPVNFQVLNRQSLNISQYQKAMIAAGGTRSYTAMGMSMVVPNTTATALPDPTPFLKGPASPPAANELGWKDTIHVPPGQVTRLLVPFGNQALGAGTPGIHFGQLVTAANVAPYNNPAEFNGPFTGTFVWHCHILEHEENDMMHSYQIV